MTGVGGGGVAPLKSMRIWAKSRRRISRGGGGYFTPGPPMCAYNPGLINVGVTGCCCYAQMKIKLYIAYNQTSHIILCHIISWHNAID